MTAALSPERALLAEISEARRQYPENDELAELQEEMEVRASQEYMQHHNLSKFLDNLMGQALRNRGSHPVQSMIRAIDAKIVQ